MDILEDALSAYHTLMRKDYCLKIGSAHREIIDIHKNAIEYANAHPYKGKAERL